VFENSIFGIYKNNCPYIVYHINYIWTSTSTNNWNTATNWTPNGVPNSASDEVTFNISGVVATCNVSTSVTIGKVNITTGSGGSALTLSTTAGRTLTVANIEDSSNKSNTISARIALLSNATFKVTNAVTLTMSGVISGSFGITKTGAGILIFSATETYTGSTTISEGTLQIGAVTTSDITIALGAKLITRRNVTAATYNNISGDGDVEILIVASGTIITLGPNITYTGITLVKNNGGNGTLEITGSFASNVTVNSGQTFRTAYTADGIFSNSISGAGNVQINNSTGITTTFTSPSNNYTGTTTITSGRLIIGNGTTGSMPTGQITYGNGTTNAKTLAFNLNTDKIISNVISFGTATNDNINNIDILSSNTVTLSSAPINTAGKMTLNAGTGKLILNASSARTGPTVINTGTLQINSGIVINSPITINSTGILKGNGTCANVTVQSGGTIMAGASVGTLTIDGDLTLNTGSNTTFEIDNNTDASLDRGIAYDAINVVNTTTPSTGNLNIASGSKLTMSFFNPSVDFSNIFWNSTIKTWNYIQALGGIGTFDTYDYIFNSLSGPVPGIISNLRSNDDLDITFTPNSSPIVPCFAYNNINKYSLDDDIIIHKQGKYNNNWTDINGLLLTKDHLIKYNDKVMYASEYSSGIDNIHDELVDLYSNDGRFITINNVLVATKKNEKYKISII